MDESEIDDLPYEPHLCVECAKDAELKAFVKDRAVLGAACSICANAVGPTTPTSSAEELSKLFCALVRYHYNEWQYNGHLGGDDIERLLAEDNPILNSARIAEPMEFDSFFGFVFGVPYPDYDKGIGLYAGYSDSLQNRPLAALSTSDSLDLLDAARDLETKNYFDVEPAIEKRLTSLVPAIDCHVDAEQILYRARIGTAGRYVDWLDPGLGIIHEPYTGKKIDAPPPELAGSGRANRQGVSFLYVTSNLDTAVAEVRPHPGHILSTAAFKATKRLRLANFGQLRLRDFAASDLVLDDYHLAMSIDRQLRMPITPEERRKYSLTQMVADILRKKGFDGIRYSSSVGEGFNLCIFSPANLAQIDGSARVIAVTELKYATKEVRHTLDTTGLHRIDR